jgi:hypothetical protein
MRISVAIAGLDAFSVVMTGAGIFTFLLPWAERLAPDHAALIGAGAAGLFTLVIEWLVYGLWWRVGTEGAFRPPANPVAALCASTLSWGGGAGASCSSSRSSTSSPKANGPSRPDRGAAARFRRRRLGHAGRADRGCGRVAPACRAGAGGPAHLRQRPHHRLDLRPALPAAQPPCRDPCRAGGRGGGA